MNEFIEISANKQSLANRKKIIGVGINDADYQVHPKINGKTLKCPYYVVWTHMIERCYSREYHVKQPTYVNCSVCADWLVFSNFKAWMINQDWNGKQLDKDLLVRGNKHYSPDTCTFVSHAINSLFNDSKSTRGQCAIGVYHHKHVNKYQACCNMSGKNKSLGYYKTEKEASKTYLAFKKELIIRVANTQTDLKLKQALLYIANTEY